MHHIDLTQTTCNGMRVFPGDKSPEITQMRFFEQGGIADHRIISGVHAGTHMDGPMHMVNNGKKLCDLPIETFFGNGLLVDARGKGPLQPDAFSSAKEGDAVIIHTGDSIHFGTERYYTMCRLILTEEAARFLVSCRICLLGLDTSTPDVEPYAIHRILLGAEIPIIENLCNVEQLLEIPSFEIIALPAKFDTDSAPVRVVARIT